MRQRAWTTLAAVAIMVSGLGSLPVQAHSLRDKQVGITLPIGADTRVFAMGPQFGKTPPVGWTGDAFNDSTWDRPFSVRTMPHEKRQYVDLWFPKQLPYWGTYQDEFYLFRRSFTLPTATSYHGYLSYKGMPTAYVHILFNGHTLGYSQMDEIGSDLKGFDISRWAKAGKNVFAVYAGPTTEGSALYFSIHVDARGL